MLLLMILAVIKSHRRIPWPQLSLGYVSQASIMESANVSEQVSEEVFERDGRKCWLCNSEVDLHIVRQINDQTAFSQIQENATIPSLISNPSHPDNLFPLCAYCHAGYDAAFSDWVLIPDKETLRKYIDHEKNDYEQRFLISQKYRSVPPRSLPFIDRSKILYHPLIITQPTLVKDYLRGDTHWPKHWLGEPTTVIHRAVNHGLFNSNPVQPFRIRRGRMWQIGVPETFQILVGELIGLWARQPLRARGRRGSNRV